MAQNHIQIKRALVSVYDKTGLDELARALGEAGVEIVSTGSTAKRIADAGVGDALGGRPRGDDLYPGLTERAGQLVQAGLVVDAD